MDCTGEADQCFDINDTPDPAPLPAKVSDSPLYDPNPLGCADDAPPPPPPTNIEESKPVEISIRTGRKVVTMYGPKSVQADNGDSSATFAKNLIGVKEAVTLSSNYEVKHVRRPKIASLRAFDEVDSSNESGIELTKTEDACCYDLDTEGNKNDNDEAEIIGSNAGDATSKYKCEKETMTPNSSGPAVSTVETSSSPPPGEVVTHETYQASDRTPVSPLPHFAFTHPDIFPPNPVVVPQTSVRYQSIYSQVFVPASNRLFYPVRQFSPLQSPGIYYIRTSSPFQAPGMTYSYSSLLQPSRFDRYHASLPIQASHLGRNLPSQFEISTPNPFYPSALSSAMSLFSVVNHQSSRQMGMSPFSSNYDQLPSSSQSTAGRNVSSLVTDTYAPRFSFGWGYQFNYS